MPSLDKRLQVAVATLEGPARFQDYALAVKSPSDEVLFVAGGRWDTHFKRYLDPVTEGDVDDFITIKLVESQLEFFRWGAEWIARWRDGYPQQESLALLGGDRRGGKTFVLMTFGACVAVDVPLAPSGEPTQVWVVAKSYTEKYELIEWMLNRVPGDDSGFYHFVQSPHPEFQFHNGARLRILSADDPDSLKQGRCDLLLVNEPQLMQPRAVSNGILGTSDRGGLSVLACNPPRTADGRGAWLYDLKSALDDEIIDLAKGKRVEPLGCKYFHFKSSDNAAVNQAARKRAGRLSKIIDPLSGSGDIEGSWSPPQPLACFEFDKRRHLHVPPAVGVADCTSVVASEKGEWGDWHFVAGVDFDLVPHIAAVIYKIYGDPDDPTFWAVDEFIGERRWTVAHWIETFAAWGEEWGYNPKSLLWIADASGGFQGDYHEEGERKAYEVIEAAGWTCIPPQDCRDSSKKAHNPFVSQRLDIYNDQLRRDRLFIGPKCVWFAECNQKATTRQDTGRLRLKHDKWAHAIDAGSYPIYRLAPRGDERFGKPDLPPIFVKPRRPATW